MKIYASDSAVDIEGLKKSILYLFKHVAQERGFRASRLHVSKIILTGTDVEVKFDFYGYKSILNIVGVPLHTHIPEDYWVDKYAPTLSRNLTDPTKAKEQCEEQLAKFKEMVLSASEGFSSTYSLDYDFWIDGLDTFNYAQHSRILLCCKIVNISASQYTSAPTTNDRWTLTDSKGNSTSFFLDDFYGADFFISTQYLSCKESDIVTWLKGVFDALHIAQSKLLSVDKYFAKLDELNAAALDRFGDNITIEFNHDYDESQVIDLIPSATFDIYLDDTCIKSTRWITNVFTPTVTQFLDDIQLCLDKYAERLEKEQQKQEETDLYYSGPQVLYEDEVFDDEVEEP